MSRRYLVLLSSLLVGGLVFVILSQPAHAQEEGPIYNHLTCFKAKDSQKTQAMFTLDAVQDAFDPPDQCKVKGKAKLFCVPSDKDLHELLVDDEPANQVEIQDSEFEKDVFCYKLKCPKPPNDISEQQITDQFGTRVLSKFKSKFLCTQGVKGVPTTTTSSTTSTTTSNTTTTTQRFVDTGETIIDNQTGLEWEKKDGVGGGADYNNPHDVDNTYTWNIGLDPYTAPNGTAFTDFLSRLNLPTGPGAPGTAGPTDTGCFANHCGWRLPTIEELQTILLESYPCEESPCLDPIFNPLTVDWYWSASTKASYRTDAYRVRVSDGFPGSNYKGLGNYIRAVRGGP